MNFHRPVKLNDAAKGDGYFFMLTKVKRRTIQ
jgi:hypothetical protein